MTADLGLALQLADFADAVTLRRFRDPQLGLAVEPDGSLVTDADREVEGATRFA